MKYLNDRPELSQYHGTSQYYLLTAGRKNMNLTDGSLALAQKFSCFWLMNLIASYQNHEEIKKLSIQFWELHLDEKGGCNVFCIEDTGLPKIINQHIPFTDIEGNVKIWVQNNVIFLPSEY